MRTLLGAIKRLEQHNWQFPLGLVELAAAQPVALPSNLPGRVSAVCNLIATPFHSSACCRDDSDAAGEYEKTRNGV